MNRIYKFGEFTVDTGERLISRAGGPVPLTPKTFDLLVVLLERRGRLVDKDELFKLVWPETFVEESNLTYTISMLRKALGDADFIETVPKRGYRFVGQVAGPSATAAPRRLAARFSLLAAAIAAAAIVVALGWSLRPRRSQEPAEIRPLTAYEGWQNMPSLSPDAIRVAFSWDRSQEENADIYVQQVGAGAPVRLTSDPAHDLGPAWSPDGKTLAFLRYDRTRETLALLTIPGTGGPERKVADLEYIRPGILMHVSYGNLLSWHPGGEWIAVPDAEQAGVPQGIFLVSTATGAKRRLTTSLGGAAADFGPAFRPDGRYLSFVRASSYAASEVFGLELTSDLRPAGRPLQLTHAGHMTISPVWLPGGRELIVLSGGISHLAPWRLNALTGTSRRMELAPEGMMEISGVTRPNGALTAVYTRDVSDSDIWRIGPDGHAQPIVASTRDDQFPQFSPDGTMLAFTSSRTGDMEVWTCRADGSNPLQITSFGGIDVGSPSWSPDGRRLAFEARPEGHGDIFTVGSAGGEPVRITRDLSQDIKPSWSHDGKWIYFRSTRSGRPELWKMRPDGSGSAQMTKEGAEGATESPDGRFLYYNKSVSKVYGAAIELWRIPAEGGREERVVDSHQRRTAAFAVVDEGIYFVSSARPYPIQFLRLIDRRLETVYTPSRGAAFGLTVWPRTRGSRRTIVYSEVHGGSDLMLIENLR